MALKINIIEFAVHFVFIFLLFISLNYYYSRVQNQNAKYKVEVVSKVTKKTYTVLNPYHVLNKVQDKYEQLFDITNFSFLINSKPCESYPSGLLLLVIVTSNPRNFEKRNAIRKTWGQNVDTTRVVFLFGEPVEQGVSDQIRNESIAYGDIVQGNFREAYRNMTYKHVMGLKWVTHHCPQAKYVLKIDDDVLVNSDELRRFLSKDLSPWGARDLIMCPILDGTQPFRTGTKWMVTFEEYAPEYYPRYCAGWAVLYSTDVIQRLLIASESIPYFWIDDVYVTGLCANKIDAPRTSIGGLILTNDKADVLKTQGLKGTGRFLIGPFEIDAERVIELWTAMAKYNLNTTVGF